MYANFEDWWERVGMAYGSLSKNTAAEIWDAAVSSVKPAKAAKPAEPAPVAEVVKKDAKKASK